MSIDNIYDSGYVGQIRSLGGVLGAAGFGLIVYTNTPAPVSTAVVVVIGPSPGRVWTLITNEGTVDVQLSFEPTFGGGYHTLKPNGSFVINKDFPWTGPVYAQTLAGTGLLGVTTSRVRS